ncbi:esterase/lipase family protein [Glaciecola sp. SC05]|uniref:esterase/lipase family protein n=1 Tax=Glaciecola sp. SC05 TaxID=1987355 RepID=UPI0035287F91
METEHFKRSVMPILIKIRSLFLLLILAGYCSPSFSAECVVLLHGLARTASSMEALETKLSSEGFYVANIDYPSREMTIEALSELAIAQGIEGCKKAKASPINFVTHSLGGILVRQFYKTNQQEDLKRVVMLGPPNKGSEVVDNLKDVPGFEFYNGPAGMQLGTGENDVPKRLGPVNFDLGVIAGTRSINFILSRYLPDPDDGKVSVASTKVEGMCSFLTLPVSHTFMMSDDDVIVEVIEFLKSGAFVHVDALNFCGSSMQASRKF